MSDNVLSVTQIHKAYGPRVLFDEVTFALDAGEKIGLIGDNGAGKSTLLAILAGVEAPDSGTVAVRTGVRIARLEQVPTLDPDKTAREVLTEPLGALREAIQRYEDAASRLDPSADDWLHKVEQLGGWDWAHRIDKVASEVGLEAPDALIREMSGGQQKRVALGRLILEDPDVILFDEPTNHLDADTIEWLEAWITKSRAAIVVVTHDRYFLENAVNRMAELRDGRIRTYDGAYSDYLAARAEEEELRRRTGHRRLKMLETELDWARRSPKARTTKSRARLDRVDDLADEVKRLRTETRRADFTFDDAPRLGKTILELDHVTAGFEPGRPVVDDLSLMIRRGERLGIIGPNGSGKTTMLRLVTGDLEPERGRVVRGAQTRIAYFDQHRSVLDDAVTVRDTICPEGGDRVFVGGEAMHAVSWLERFGFTSEAHKMRVGSLSGGERNRLALARFLLADANVILLDEPTNDLDLMTMHVLEEALLGFGGCALVVSHDRYFLDRIATTIVAFEGREDGPARITVQPGDYTTWRRLLQADRDAAAAAAASEAAWPTAVAAAPGSARAVPKTQQRLSYKERQELEGLEPRIEGLEAEVASLEAELADPAAWSDGGGRGLAAQTRRDAARAELDALYARWEDLAARDTERA